MNKIIIIDDDWTRRRDSIYENILKEDFEIVPVVNGSEVFLRIQENIETASLFIIDISLNTWQNNITNNPLTVLEVLDFIGKDKRILLVSNQFSQLIDNGNFSYLMHDIIEKKYNISNFIVWNDFINAYKFKEQKGEKNHPNPLDSLINRIKLEVLLGNEKNKLKNKFSVDLIILAALDEEMQAFLKTTKVDDKDDIDADGFTFKKGKIMSKSNRSISFVIAKQRSMGMVESAYLSSIALTNFDTQFLVMIGVCGGRKGFANIGDVVIPAEVIAYQNGKLSAKGFEADIGVAQSNVDLAQKLTEEYCNTILKNLWTTYVNNKMQNEGIALGLVAPEIRFKEMACGDVIINQEGKLDEIAEKSAKRNLASVDMESYSILKANVFYRQKNVKTFVVKSVMDESSNKTDKYKDYACYLSANFLFRIIEDCKLIS